MFFISSFLLASCASPTSPFSREKPLLQYQHLVGDGVIQQPLLSPTCEGLSCCQMMKKLWEDLFCSCGRTTAQPEVPEEIEMGVPAANHMEERSPPTILMPRDEPPKEAEVLAANLPVIGGEVVSSPRNEGIEEVETLSSSSVEVADDGAVSIAESSPRSSSSGNAIYEMESLPAGSPRSSVWEIVEEDGTASTVLLSPRPTDLG